MIEPAYFVIVWLPLSQFRTSVQRRADHSHHQFLGAHQLPDTTLIKQDLVSYMPIMHIHLYAEMMKYKAMDIGGIIVIHIYFEKNSKIRQVMAKRNKC